MSLADVTSARSSPAPACPDCDTTASVTSDLHKYQVACTCSGSAQYACADDPGPPPPVKPDTPPALPPRPPASALPAQARNNASVGCNGQDASCRRRKYAWWCVGCGALAAALGGLLAAQHILVRAYTASPHHLETVPAAVPAAMLVLTGVCIMSLARRRNRYSYMIKVVGACCLMCALTCVLVTITTTVIHMNKLQTLKFCEYTKLTRTCTCFSMPPDLQHDNDDEGVRCVFEGVSECGVVHGALYWCLRGVFALSVSAVLVCIFSCMLAYQLLSHERKKMYWEQLELRCRSLYRPAATQAAGNSQPACGCCQCHPQPAWDISLQHRFWAPGRIGNLYSPNPGAGRKTSAWSWFPWPRSNSQNSRCRMGGVPQSGDSAYGFCDTDAANTGAQYDERAYHAQHAGPTFQAQANFTPTQANFQGPSFQQTNLPSGSFSQGYQEFPESSSYDAQTGVWGPPPPYSPQGRGGNRHPHIHAQDPAAATLLHRHHIDVHRTHTHETHTCTRSYIHDRDRNNDRNELVRSNADIVRANEIRGSADMARMGQEMIRGNSEMGRLNPEMARLNPEMARLNPEMARLNPEMARCNPEMARLNPEMARLNPEMARLNPEMARLNPEMARLNPEMARLNPEMGHMMYPSEEIEMGHMQDGRFNTLRGHLVPYRCQRLGMSASNLHSCRADENVTIECVHQKSISKVSDQSSDSCPPKQGKENLGFQNDKHSPIRSSMQDCGVNQLAESEVYFADVSSCCNVSVKADCCMNPTVSALVGTIENHPESTSESDTGSFTLTRQRPQPQGSKRRPRTDKHNSRQDKRVNTSGDRMVNSSLRLTEHQIEQLNLRMNERIVERMGDRIGSDRMNNERIGSERIGGDRMNNERIGSERIGGDRMNNERIGSDRISGDRMNNERIGSDRIVNERMGSDRICNERMSGDRNLNERMGSDRIGNERICNERMGSDRIVNERMGSDRIVNERIGSDRIVNERITGDRVANERIGSERAINERCDRMVNERMGSDRLATERIDRMDRNEMRMSERMNDSRDRLNERNDLRDRLNEREEKINDSRISDRMNDSRISDRMNETRLSERLNDSRFERMNDSRISERLNDSRMDRLNESRLERMNDSRISDRMNESRISDRMNETRNSERMNERIRMNDSLNESRHSAIERMSDLNSSIRIEGSSKMRSHISPLRLPKTSPKIKENKDSKEFFIPAPVISPLSPNTEESLLSDDGQDQVYSNDPGGSKCLGPDSQYEVREEKGEILKGNHVHCYSDTNTMDSGWQSGSEKQVTD